MASATQTALRRAPPHRSPTTRPGDEWFRGLDGRDLGESMRVARAIIAAGAWRGWMLKRFMRLHRRDLSRLMQRLGPLIPPRHAHADERAPALLPAVPQVVQPFVPSIRRRPAPTSAG
jgi:hypothetical protein